MAVPTIQRETPQTDPQVSRFPPWLRKYAAVVGRPLFAVILAVIIGGIVIMFTSPGSLPNRFATIFSAYGALWSGSFGSLVSISNTLVKVTPLIFASLSVAISFRAGLFNIGAAGQIVVGAMSADILALKEPTWPGWVLIPLMILLSMAVGALWGAIVGFLKAWRGAHEVVTTIMLNWIGFSITDYLIEGPFSVPGGIPETKALPPQAQLPQLTTAYNATLGHFLPSLPQADTYQYLVDVSIFLALLAIVVYWFISKRTAFGYEIRVLGQNPRAAAYAGIPTRRNILLVMIIAGAFAGLGGALHLMGQFPYQMAGMASRSDPTGFDAIGASLVGLNTPIGVLFGSLLFGGLRAASPLVQASGISGDIVLVLEALVLFCIASEFLPALKRLLPPWLRLLPERPKQALFVAPVTSAPVGMPVAIVQAEAPPVESEGEVPLAEHAGEDGTSLKEE